MQRFWIGETVLTEGRFTDPASGVAVAATGVRLRYRRAGGGLVEVDAAEIEAMATGVFRARITPAEPGVYTLRWDATGPDGAVVEEAFEIVRGAVLG